MRIFNVEINGKDAELFCNLSKDEQFAWILKFTTQKNEDVINDFLKKKLDPNKKEYCYSCRDNKQKVSIAKIVEDGNISKGNEPEVEPSSKRTNVKNSRKRRNS
jgi:hypothetical protein